MTATLYTDGGARGNPGPAATGYVLTLREDKLIKEGKYIGKATNNQAEYEALLAGLARAQEEGVEELNCFLDSELIVKQLAGEYRVRDNSLRPKYETVCALIEKFKTVTFTHVPRAKNKIADGLVNEALDRNKKTT